MSTIVLVDASLGVRNTSSIFRYNNEVLRKAKEVLLLIFKCRP